MALLVRGLPDRPSQADYKRFRARLWRSTIDARRKANLLALRQYREHSKYGFTPVAPLPYYPPKVFERAVSEFVVTPFAEAEKARIVPRKNDIVKGLQGRMASHVHGVARATTSDLIEQENDYLDSKPKTNDRVGWARVLQGESSCSFCIMLASRGAVYGSREKALYDDVGHKFHDNCDCDAWPVYRSQWKTWSGAADAEAYYKLWLSVTSGLSGKKARNAFRRYLDRQRRNGKSRPRDLIAA